MKRQLIFIPVIFFLGNIHAQDTVKIFPGSKEIDFGKLKPHTSKLNMYFDRENKRTETGTYTDSFAITVKDGKKVFARYASLPSRNLFDTAYYDMNTLQSLSNHETSSVGSWTLAYSTDKVVGSYYDKRKDSSTVIDQTMESAFFDGYLNDFLPRFLKLKDNYTAKIPLYSFGQKGVSWIIVHVIGSETMRMPDGKATSVWVVQVSFPGSPTKTNLYVTKNTRDILKIQMTGKNVVMTKEAI